MFQSELRRLFVAHRPQPVARRRPHATPRNGPGNRPRSHPIGAEKDWRPDRRPTRRRPPDLRRKRCQPRCLSSRATCSAPSSSPVAPCTTAPSSYIVIDRRRRLFPPLTMNPHTALASSEPGIAPPSASPRKPTACPSSSPRRPAASASSPSAKSSSTFAKRVEDRLTHTPAAVTLASPTSAIRLGLRSRNPAKSPRPKSPKGASENNAPRSRLQPPMEVVLPAGGRHPLARRRR